ncbi:hypothetical protein GCM10011611_42180 [Aliidongia dinghuensis]|uniref:Uncharacterized protein n=1 Tax=Aliidongia dinghuensis TaxID=1867774 RepID=A0A8J2YWP8_9PROT|nr:hypothetical protein [Aliidongia dinghuensis]GGF31612.1 hypothetical protein GCM10011611_42180 [Aliidongia dinghuensis]
MTDPAAIRWLTPTGEPVSCVEKLKVLTENLVELKQMAQDALEDAILMGCDEAQVRRVLADLMAGLENPYAKH